MERIMDKRLSARDMFFSNLIVLVFPNWW